MAKIALNLSKKVLRALFEKSNQLSGNNPLLPESGDFGIDEVALAVESEADFNFFVNDFHFMETLDNYLYRVANDQKVVTVALWKEFERVLEESKLPMDKSAFRPMLASEKEAYDRYLAEAINEVFSDSQANSQFTKDLEHYRRK